MKRLQWFLLLFIIMLITLAPWIHQRNKSHTFATSAKATQKSSQPSLFDVGIHNGIRENGKKQHGQSQTVVVASLPLSFETITSTVSPSIPKISTPTALSTTAVQSSHPSPTESSTPTRWGVPDFSKIPTAEWEAVILEQLATLEVLMGPSATPENPNITPTPWHTHADLSYIPADRREAARQGLATTEALIGPLPKRETPPPVGDGYYPAGDGTLYENPAYRHPNYANTYRFQNHWHATTSSEDIFVDAGCLRENPEQGVVRVEYKALVRPSLEPFTRPTQRVFSPISAGCLKITGADGMQLFLVTTGVSATQEISFTFDVSTATFLPQE